MKIEHLLAQYFYSVKKITLQGIGTFTLSPDFVMPAENDKAMEIPQDAISFQFNSRAAEDAGLIDYIVQQTRKIKPLASSDLESYIVLGSQFLNIGKPFKIDGIGVLEKSQNGDYQFTPLGHFANAKIEDAPVTLREKTEEAISFSNEAKAGGNGKKIAVLLAGLLLLVAIGWAAWYFLTRKKTAEPVATITTQQKVSTVPPAADTLKKDSSTAALPLQKDSIKPVVPVPGGYSFKVVLKNYPSLMAAQKAYDRLTGYGHKLLLYTADSVTYKVAMPFTRPLADTAYARDSVRKILFGGNPYIELK